LPKLKPKSADKSRDHFRYIASELIEAGIVPDQIDLAFIVRPENVEIATERMRERLGQDASSGLANRIATIKAAARHLKLLLKSDLDLLETFRRNCAPENDGQTDKNAARMDQFDDLDLCRRFVCLADKLWREAMAKRGTRAGARLAVLAIAFEIALRTAARGGNVSSIEYKRHFHKSGNGFLLRIPKGEVKNRRAIEWRVTPKVIAMLDDYFKHHHRILAPDGSDWLFPNEADPTRQRPDGSLMNALSIEIRRRLQIDFSGHTFRHLVAKLLIRADPAYAPLARRVLGHSPNSSATGQYMPSLDPGTSMIWDDTIDNAGRDVRRQAPRRQLKPSSVTPSPF
jgi:integrase